MTFHRLLRETDLSETVELTKSEFREDLRTVYVEHVTTLRNAGGFVRAVLTCGVTIQVTEYTISLKQQIHDRGYSDDCGCGEGYISFISRNDRDWPNGDPWLPQTNRTRWVPTENLPGLQAKIETLNAKARKLGIPEAVLLEGNRKVQEEKDPHTDRVKRRRELIEITIISEPIKLAGWSFVSRIWHAGGAGNILETIPGMTIPTEYRNAGPDCDHCKTARRRNDTFIVRNEAGEYKQVGSTCLRDFLGVDPHEFLEQARWIKSLLDAWDDPDHLGGGGGWSFTVGLTDFIHTSAAWIKSFGYLSSKKIQEEGLFANPTGSDVFSLLITPPGEHTKAQEEILEKISEKGNEAVPLAAATLCWLGSLGDRDDNNDYLHNLHVAAEMGYVVGRSANLLASAVVACERECGVEIERRKLEERPQSEFIGEAGKRIEIQVTLEHADAWPSDYGTTYFHKLRTPEGAIVVWFGTHPLKVEESIPLRPLEALPNDLTEAQRGILNARGKHDVDPDSLEAEQIISGIDPDGTALRGWIESIQRQRRYWEERKLEEDGWTYEYCENAKIRRREVNLGETIWVRGTVKRHQVRNGKGRFPAEKQTIMNRLAVIDEPKPKVKQGEKNAEVKSR